MDWDAASRCSSLRLTAHRNGLQLPSAACGLRLIAQCTPFTTPSTCLEEPQCVAGTGQAGLEEVGVSNEGVAAPWVAVGACIELRVPECEGPASGVPVSGRMRADAGG